jgi:uncharacterized membrane protein
MILLKAISWRVVGTIDTAIIAWFVTGRFSIAMSIASIETITKILLFYIHEKVWSKLS